MKLSVCQILIMVGTLQKRVQKNWCLLETCIADLMGILFSMTVFSLFRRRYFLLLICSISVQ